MEKLEMAVAATDDGEDWCSDKGCQQVEQQPGLTSLWSWYEMQGQGGPLGAPVQGVDIL